MRPRIDPDTAAAIEAENAERETQQRIAAGLYYRAGVYIHLSGYPDKGWALRDAASAVESAIQSVRA